MTETLLQAAGKLELPAGIAPPLNLPPARSIYGGTVAAANAADADKEFSAAAATFAINVRMAKGGDLARPLADTEIRSELAAKDDIHCDDAVAGRRWVNPKYQIVDAAGTPTAPADPALGRSGSCAGRSVAL